MNGERVVVLGAGITGLACAYELAGRGASPLVLEADTRVGGKVLSPPAARDGVVFEAGPDSFVTSKPAALELALALGLEDRLLTTHAEKKGMWVYTRGRLRRFPEGLLLMAPTNLGAFLRSDVVGWAAKLRMGFDFFLPAGNAGADESIGAFAARRFGVEAAESFINPVMAGIHSGNPDRLSLRSTFPQFFRMEREFGSVWRAMRAGAKRRPRAQPGRSLFMTLRGGLETLTRALRDALPADAVRLNAQVESIRAPSPGRYEIRLAGGEIVSANRVVCTLPAPRASRVLKPASEELARSLAAIPFASTATVSLAYAGEDVPASIVGGYGFVVDRREARTISGATYSSTKFPGRVPEGTVLVRCFAGGADRGDVLQIDDAALAEAVRGDLEAMAGLDARPVEVRVARWPQASPQYEVGHAERVEAIERGVEALRGFILAGASYRGIGLPDCIRSGREAAARMIEEGGDFGRVV